MFLEPSEIQFHLPLVRGPERLQLQVDGHKAPQPPMIEEQIEVVVHVIHGNTLLTGDEREIRVDLPLFRGCALLRMNLQ